MRRGWIINRSVILHNFYHYDSRNKQRLQAVNSARNSVDCQDKIGKTGGFKELFEYCCGV